MSTKLAFFFPGQGSQSVGMLSELAGAFPQVKETYDLASEALGYDLWKLIQEGPDSELMITERTQPAMLAAGFAVWRVWKATDGERPGLMAGHSLGEYTALVCSGALDFQEAIRLVADRGKFMQEAVPQGVGAIAAIIGLRDDTVKEVCTRAAEEEVVAAVNFNAPDQIVVAGHATAVERALKLAKDAGAKRSVLLPMSVPAHSPLMESAMHRLEARLAETQLNVPTVPVIHNVDLSKRKSGEDLRAVLAKQLYSPVRWADTVRQVAKEGYETVIECGPGKVLTSLTKRVSKEIKALPVFDTRSLDKALAAIREQAGRVSEVRPLRAALETH